tara:strand:- start:1648 stop:2535 length:888 start_codon:yes stop_codon:yes gene_type:complete
VDNKSRKGVILAGGKGSRLNPLTIGISKQLMPIYDKPMIYYPLSTLLLCGIREILVICDPLYLDSFKRVLSNGNQWGVDIKYKCQERPDGIAQALLLAEEFLEGSPLCLILGDNLFYGDDLTFKLKEADKKIEGGTIFAYQVSDPSRYGIVSFDHNLKVNKIEEKPENPSSNYAITGIYFYSNSVIEIAKTLKPSKRGELEITDINKSLLRHGKLNVQILRRGMAWLDTGTFDSLHEAGAFIKTVEKRQDLKIGCPEEIAWKLNYINEDKLKELASKYSSSSYGKYLLKLLNKEI